MNNNISVKTINNELFIDEMKASDLVKKYGSPLYVYDKNYIKKICKSYIDSIKNNYGNGIIAYASKAFSCKEIYRLINECGLYTDVVSGGEIYTALSVDFPASKMIFHGNNKLFSELELAIKNKIYLIVIDSYSELDDIEKLCVKYNTTQNVLIRVNLGITAHTHHYIQTANPDSKFGFSIDSMEAENIIFKTKEYKHINLCGLHSHIGSQIFGTKSFIIAVEKIISFYKKMSELGFNFSILDLGGGFGAYYYGDDVKMSSNDYYDIVEQISNKVKEQVLLNNLTDPQLILEPGRSIVCEAGITLYTVGRIKEIKDIKNYISVDGGMFESPRHALYQAQYTVLNANKVDDKIKIKYTIAGKCCESGDIITEDVFMPKTKEGDIIAVLSTGAYNYSMASNYNRNLVPPVVFVDKDKSYYAVKPQSYSDIIRNDL